ncbi:MAG: hypothetical protein A2X86_01735 [Bdellovibrionales bacterium GWA2_49_15]|nr:MAG: hypothetical protein A2X86_01735 [Bdellovibrionales bacterium GWA2_49_15]
MRHIFIFAALLLVSTRLFGSERIWVPQVTESAHPYHHLSPQVWKVHSLDAEKLTLVFERLALAKGDSLVLTNERGGLLARYDGPMDLADFASEEFPGHLVKLSLVSDEHNNQWGFRLKGFFYTRERPATPQIILNYPLKLQNRAFLKGFFLFQNGTLNVLERVYQENGLPITGKIARLKFSDAGVESLPEIYTSHVADGPLATIDGALFGGFEGSIAKLPRGFSFEMYRPFATVSQLFTQDNLVVALAGGRVHLIDTQGESGWQYTLERSALPSVILEDSDRIAFKDKMLVINRGWTAGEIALIDLTDPYGPVSRPKIQLNLSEQNRLIFSGHVPTIGKGHVYLPNGNSVSAFSLKTGNEVGYLLLPEIAGSRANSFYFENDILYVPGHSKIYRVNVADPSAPELIDEIEVTREVRSQGIHTLWVEDKRLYVLRKNQGFQSHGENGFTLTIIRLP